MLMHNYSLCDAIKISAIAKELEIASAAKLDFLRGMVVSPLVEAAIHAETLRRSINVGRPHRAEKTKRVAA